MRESVEAEKSLSNNGKVLSNIPSKNNSTKGGGGMLNKKVRSIVIHMVKPSNSNVSIPDKMNELHIEIIKRKLEQTHLTTEQKVTVINKIIENLKSKERSSFIA